MVLETAAAAAAVEEEAVATGVAVQVRATKVAAVVVVQVIFTLLYQVEQLLLQAGPPLQIRAAPIGELLEMVGQAAQLLAVMPS